MKEAETPLWFGHLRQEWAGEMTSAAAASSARSEKEGRARHPVAGTTAEPQDAELDFMNDRELTPTIAVQRFRKRMAEALIYAFGNRAKASAEMKRRSDTTDQATIGRWLNSNADGTP